MITFKTQHILNTAAKNRIFWRNFKPQLQLQIIPKYDHFQGSTYTKPCSQKTDILAKFKPQLQLQIIPMRPDQYDNL